MQSAGTILGEAGGVHNAGNLGDLGSRHASGQSLTGHIWMYNPHAHPQFNNSGQLLISYDISSDAGADLIYLDAYRPKFIRVPIAGLH
jgi:hypothetical protein